MRKKTNDKTQLESRTGFRVTVMSMYPSLLRSVRSSREWVSNNGRSSIISKGQQREFQIPSSFNIDPFARDEPRGGRANDHHRVNLTTTLCHHDLPDCDDDEGTNPIFPWAHENRQRDRYPVLRRSARKSNISPGSALESVSAGSCGQNGDRF